MKQRYMAAALLALGWAATSWMQFSKYFPGGALLVLLLGVAAFASLVTDNDVVGRSESQAAVETMGVGISRDCDL
jgi:hypothetical protein